VFNKCHFEKQYNHIIAIKKKNTTRIILIEGFLKQFDNLLFVICF